MKKYQSFFIWKVSVFRGEIFYIFEQACLRNDKMDNTAQENKTI